MSDALWHSGCVRVVPRPVPLAGPTPVPLALLPLPVVAQSDYNMPGSARTALSHGVVAVTGSGLDCHWQCPPCASGGHAHAHTHARTHTHTHTTSPLARLLCRHTRERGRERYNRRGKHSPCTVCLWRQWCVCCVCFVYGAVICSAGVCFLVLTRRNCLSDH